MNPVRCLYRQLIFVLLVSILSTCQASPTPTHTPPLPTHTPPLPTYTPPLPTHTSPSPSSDVIYLAIIWHQHQPVYYKDPATGIYAKPWVRVHAAKDYYDMAAILKQYPNVHVTFNLTPSLVRQLDDFAAGASDMYWEMALAPADALTDEQKRFILRYFFDINPKIIRRFPRYVELQGMRSGVGDAEIAAAMASWSAQDYRDLQVLFNLGWTDPDFLAQEPLAGLVAKGRGYTEEDKRVVLEEHLRILKQVIPLHKAMQDAGQIEVTMTPFAHPILPLLVDTTLAKIALPSAELPAPPFRYGQDAVAHLERGVAMYRDHFGVDPRGMWPAEGSVAQMIVNMVGRAGIRWMASDEGVLARSLGMDSFARDTNDLVQEADKLYRPYTVAGADGIPVAIVFRDVVLSDKVGFTYSGMAGKSAAADFVRRIHDIRERLKAEGASGPNLVTVILDGENAWEYYDNDGKEFLHTLYQKLSEDARIVTVTPSEYLARFPQEPGRRIDDLWPGSWIGHNFSTWIGEDEENRAWGYLSRVREILQKYETGLRTPPGAEALEEARVQMYIAEGSDWFWWYGADQNSGADEDFDRQYRETLKRVLVALGEEPPDWLSVPIIAQSPAAAERAASDLLQPTIDGVAGAGEWDTAGYYTIGGAMAAGSLPLERLYYGFDARHLYLRVDGAQDWAALTTARSDDARTTVGVYLLPPGGGVASAFSIHGGEETYLGFGATYLAQVVLGPQAAIVDYTLYRFAEDDWSMWARMGMDGTPVVGVGGDTLEMAVPLAPIAPEGAALDSGERIQLRLVLSQGTVKQQADTLLLPTGGPALLTVPDLGLTTPVLTVEDPLNDDHGPGGYTYPTDAVFQPGCFDATSFSVGYDEQHIVFRVALRGPLNNVWNSPNGVSVQTVDIYVDKDGPAAGARLLLPGRNAALSADYAWDYAIWVEGWTPGVYIPGAEAPLQIAAEMTIIADPGQSKITIKVPRAVLGDDPQNWAYLAVISGQEGYPSTGVWRVRDVNAEAGQWRFGGAPADANHTRIVDVVWPTGMTPTQEEALSAYPPVQQSSANPGPDTVAQLGMLRP